MTSGHEPFDDRIFHHMAVSLSAHNNNVIIISSIRYLTDFTEGVEINSFAGDNLTKREKIRQFTVRLTAFNPDVIICSEPLPLFAARKYSKKIPGKIRIIYDITEWYPSKKNLSGLNYPLRLYSFIRLLLFNIREAAYADSFIFGEWYKSRPYRILFPRKPFIYVSYYPDLKYIPYTEPSLTNNLLRLTYSGKISIEKGFGNFISVIQTLTDQNKELKIDLKIIGWPGNERDRTECEKLLKLNNPRITVETFDRQSLSIFTELIKETDIFLELRSDDFENQHCLPIKLFYYAALGRPVIYTDLKAIRRETEAGVFGFPVNPDDHNEIARIVLNYVNNKELYYQHCRNARKLAETKYNWQESEPQFIKFLSL